jgi:hypothetical protein
MTIKRIGFKTFELRIDPNDDERYYVDWSPDLEDGETITASTWTESDGLTVHDDDFDDTVTSTWITGGQSGAYYELVNQIETSTGETVEAHIHVRTSHTI